MNSSSVERSTVISFLKNHLVGPLGGPDEVLPMAPASYYTCGVLFPQSEGELEFNSWESNSDQDEFGDSSADESGDDPQWPTTSIYDGTFFFHSIINFDEHNLGRQVCQCKWIPMEARAVIRQALCK